MDPDSFACPLPLSDHPRILLGHGGGGRLSAELVQQIFLAEFGQPDPSALGDSTPLQLSGSRIAVSTDSFVVRPLFFPGGSIGDLAVNGTINDLAMSGARPAYLTAGFILEEGLPVDDLRKIVRDMGAACRQAGVAIVAGDTKVVERGHGDGCYINTTGIGLLADDVQIAVHQARPGDLVILSGTLADHGMAIISRREGLEFEAEIFSDTCSLADLVQAMLGVSRKIRVLRDPTRGGIATSLNEIAAASGCGIVIDQARLPLNRPVAAACEFLGLDPLQVANEGKLIAVVAPEDATMVVDRMRRHPAGRQASIIGEVVDDPQQLVVARTPVGTHRVVTMPLGEQLPRIC